VGGPRDNEASMGEEGGGSQISLKGERRGIGSIGEYRSHVGKELITGEGTSWLGVTKRDPDPTLEEKQGGKGEVWGR